MGHPDHDALQREVAEIRRMVQRVHDGLLWFLDPPEDDSVPRIPGCSPTNARNLAKGKTDRAYDYGDPVRLKKIRPKVWATGRRAREQGKPKAMNPYRDTRGGHRNAWFGGWTERDDELQENPQDP